MTQIDNHLHERQVMSREHMTRLRYAPSPTGFQHIGGFRTALWLGMDIDEGPLVGGPYGPYYQTQRKALYQQYAHQLIASGHAYRCYCTPQRLEEMRKQQEAQKLPPRYDRHCRYLSDEERAANDAAGLKWVVRFAMFMGILFSRIATSMMLFCSNRMVYLPITWRISSMTI